MKSMTRTAPSPVSNSISSTSVSPRYRRRTDIPPSAGAISHRPCSPVPSKAAKIASESNRGTHNQSIDPSRPTNAADCVSPITA
jgi:hypothetical protein